MEAAIDPTVEELASLDTIEAALSWAMVPDCVAKPLFQSLGNPTHFRHVALMPKEAFDAAVASVRVQQWHPPGGCGSIALAEEGDSEASTTGTPTKSTEMRGVLPVEAAQVEAFRRACVCKCGGKPSSAANPASPAASPAAAAHSPSAVAGCGVARLDGASDDAPAQACLEVDHITAVAKATREAHAGSQALSAAAEEVRLAAERNVAMQGLLQARRDHDEQWNAEQWRLLAEERERLAAERVGLNERAEALKLAEQKLEERAERLKRQYRKNLFTQRCARCGGDFVVSENGSKACNYHPGRWCQSHTSPKGMAPGMSRVGSSPVLRGAGAVAGAAAAASPTSARQGGGAVTNVQSYWHWSCCQSKDQSSPGCNVGPHVAAANHGLRSGR